MAGVNGLVIKLVVDAQKAFREVRVSLGQKTVDSFRVNSLIDVLHFPSLLAFPARRKVNLDSDAYISHSSFIRLYRSYCTTLEVSSTANRIDPSSEKEHCLTKCEL